MVNKNIKSALFLYNPSWSKKLLIASKEQKELIHKTLINNLQCIVVELADTPDSLSGVDKQIL